MKNQTKTQILIVDDHALFRAGLIKLLESRQDINIISQLDSGVDLLDFLNTHHVDVIMLDISMPGVSGLELLEKIKLKHPQLKTIMLSMHKVAEYCRLALKRGASGYVLKEDAFSQVTTALDTVLKGGQYISPSMTAVAAQSFFSNDEALLPDVLTKTEHIVLKQIALGLSNKEVAKKLGISVRTIETHRAHILKKLGVKNTAGLVQYAIGHHLIQIENA